MIRTINQDLAERMAEHNARKVVNLDAMVNIVVGTVVSVGSVLLAVHTYLRTS